MRNPTPSLGFSLIEVSMALGIIGLLGGAGLSRLDLGHRDLTAAQLELKGTLQQATLLAHAKGSPVTVGFRIPAGPDVFSVQVSSRIRWGKPAHIPLPPGMADPVQADTTGESHARIVVSHRSTATASCYFVNDGTEALCMRISGRGHLQMLRWKADQHRWTRG
jgi:prepilin-type N-terminal cleavage/methylation domain-containing protein